MKTSDKYLKKHTDDYASFAYSDGIHEGTYSEQGIEVEHAEKYAEICKLETAEQIWMHVWINIKGVHPRLEQTAEESVKLCKLKLKEVEEELET